MKLSRLIFILFLLALFTGSGVWAQTVIPAGVPSTDPSREELEAILRTFYNGVKERDFQKLKETEADVFLAKVRNDTLSRTQNFPPSPQDDPWWESTLSAMIPSEDLVFMGLKKKNGLVFLTYHWTRHFKPSFWSLVPPSDKEPHKGIFIAAFVQQKNGWRVLAAPIFVAATADDLKAMSTDQGRRGWLEEKLAWFENVGAFDVEMPPEVKAPADYVAMYVVVNFIGRKITLTVNGISQSGNSGIVLGGLKKGKNTIHVHLEPGGENDKVSERLPRMRITAWKSSLRTATPSRVVDLETTTPIFLHQWKPGEPDFETTVEVNDEILARLPKAEKHF